MVYRNSTLSLFTISRLMFVFINQKILGFHRLCKRKQEIKSRILQDQKSFKSHNKDNLCNERQILVSEMSSLFTTAGQLDSRTGDPFQNSYHLNYKSYHHGSSKRLTPKTSAQSGKKKTRAPFIVTELKNIAIIIVCALVGNL